MAAGIKTGGRQVGTPNRYTTAARHQLQDQADPLAFMARVMNGEVIDGVAPTLAERLAAARDLRRVLVPDAKERPLSFLLPPVSGSADLVAAVGAVLSAVSDGQITPGEGKAMADLLEAARRAYEAADLAERIAALERPPHRPRTRGQIQNCPSDPSVSPGFRTHPKAPTEAPSAPEAIEQETIGPCYRVRIAPCYRVQPPVLSRAGVD